MSNDKNRTPIPVLRKAGKELEKQGNKELRFEPGDYQSRVKARFYRRLEELSHHFDKDTVLQNKDLIIQLAGTERIMKWMEDPGFSRWFLDEDYVVDTIQSKQQNALDVIAQVLNNDSAHDGDRLKAARMLLELGDQFPGRKNEVRFLDDRINDMSSHEVDREIKKLQAALATGELDDGNTTEEDNGDGENN